MVQDTIEQDSFVCSICEGGNSGQVCETCHDRIPAFKSWLIQTETLPKAYTRFIVVHQTKRNSTEPLLNSTIWYSSEEFAQKKLQERFVDPERYEVREVRMVLV